MLFLLGISAKVSHAKFMSTYSSLPYLNPLGSSASNMKFGMGETPNPWFNIANQFTPRTFNDVIKWSRYITTQSPTTTEVLRKYATYPITEFIVDTKNNNLRDKYKEIFESIKLKQGLQDIGFNYHALGNSLVSLHFPIHRSLICPACKSSFSAKKLPNIKFKMFQFHGICPSCSGTVNFIRKDTRSQDISAMNLIKWNIENISVNHNPITGESEYYYKFPNDVKNKIRSGDRLFVDSTPWAMIEAVKNNQDFKFDSGSIFHLKNISMGSELNGLGLPPLISLFSLVFYQAVLRKANEAIAVDYLAPMRVAFPQAQTSQSDPAVAFSQRSFAERMEAAFRKHKVDKNHILISPVPVGYTNLGGEGKNLLVAQEIQQAEETILMSLGVSRELLSGTTNWTSSTVGLRLLENTLLSYVSQVEELINWVMRKVASYLSIDYAKVTLAPFKLSDDDTAKQILMNLVQAGNASMSTFFEAMGLDYHEELDKMKSDTIAKAKYDVESKFESELAEFMAARSLESDTSNNNDYNDKLSQAQELANQLATLPESDRRRQLTQLRASDYAQYLMVSKILEKVLEANPGPGPVGQDPEQEQEQNSPQPQQPQQGPSQ